MEVVNMGLHGPSLSGCHDTDKTAQGMSSVQTTKRVGVTVD